MTCNPRWVVIAHMWFNLNSVLWSNSCGIICGIAIDAYDPEFLMFPTWRTGHKLIFSMIFLLITVRY